MPDFVSDFAAEGFIYPVFTIRYYPYPLQYRIYQLRYDIHLRGAHSVFRDNRRAQSHAARDRHAFRVVREPVHIDDDAAVFEAFLRDDTRHALSKIRYVNQGHVVVRPACENIVSQVRKVIGESFGVFYDLELPGPILVGKCLFEEHGFCRHVIKIRRPLNARESRFLDMLPQGLLFAGDVDCTVVVSAHQNQPAPRAAGLVRACRGEMRLVNRRRMRAGNNQPGDVRDIGQKIRSCFIGYPAEFVKIDHSRIRGGPADDQPGPERNCLIPDGMVVEEKSLPIDVIVLNFKEFAAE